MEDKYCITNCDELNVTVSEKFEKKIKNEDGQFVGTGEFYYKPISYHPNLEKAYNWIIDKEINCVNLNDLEAVVNKLNELKKFIKNRSWENN